MEQMEKFIVIFNASSSSHTEYTEDGNYQKLEINEDNGSYAPGTARTSFEVGPTSFVILKKE